MTPMQRLARQWESPPVWLALFLALAWAQSRWLPLFDLGLGGDRAGIALIAAGLSIFAVAVAQFWRHQTTILPRETPEVLITTGLYRFSRNPIYLADAMILAGACLIWDAAALSLVPAFMAVITRRFIRGEEAAMAQVFGAHYHAWAAKTRRWI
jgi:protein-S-isoprenylcysteine O-methyltransferase Ste14